MAKFRVRYELGRGPEDSDDVVEVEAAAFISQGEFIDFFDSTINYSGGEIRPTGAIVFRVRGDLIADVTRMDG